MRHIRRLSVLLLVLGGAAVLGLYWYGEAKPAPGRDSSRAAQGPSASASAMPAYPALRSSGSLEAREIAVASEFGGRVAAVHVRPGDAVDDGQVLVELDATSLEAQAAQAEAAVAAAQAHLALLEAGAHPAEVLAAEASVQQAAAERAAAESALRAASVFLDDPQEINVKIAQAGAELALAVVQVEEAESRLAAAEAMRERYRAQGSLQEKGLYAVYDYQCRAAQSALDASVARRRGAEEQKRALEALRAHPVALISQVHLAETQLRIAEAGVKVAEAKLDEVKAGTAAEEVAVGKARVRKAQAALAALLAQADKLAVRSPIAGTVTSRPVEPGEIAVPGATLLTVTNLDAVWLTLYVPQADLGRVRIGQEAVILVEAYPDLSFEGRVTFVSPEAEFTPSNVQTPEDRLGMVFKVRVRVPNAEHLLKAGMPADVTLGDD